MITIVRARLSWELCHFPYGTMCPLSHTNRPPLLFVFELRGTPTAFRENFEEVSSAQGACWNWPHLWDCIVADSCTPRWRFSACHEKEGGRTSLLARSKQNKIPGDPLTLNSWWKTGKEIKLQARRLTAINLPTLCPCKKKKKNDKMWGTQKWAALYESILIFNKTIYTFLLELQVACRLPRACAIELTSVGNVLTAYITSSLEGLLTRTVFQQWPDRE